MRTTILSALAVLAGFGFLVVGGAFTVAAAGVAAALLGGVLILAGAQARAIRQRSDLEARYRNLVEQLPLITYIDSLRVERQTAAFISPQIETILGYPLDEWKNDPDAFPRHLHPDDRAHVLAAQEDARRTGAPLDIEYRMIAHDGSVVWLRDIYTTVRDEHGDPWYTQGFAVDVTERKLAEQDREKLLWQTSVQNEQLRRLDRMKDEFIALVSHELRTPLTSIRGYLELLTEEADTFPETQRGWIDIIDRNSERLLSLVEDLLLSAQAEDGSVRLTVGAFDLTMMLEECLRAHEQTATSRRIAMSYDVKDAGTIRGDRRRIAQAFDNVLSNALKFTPQSGRVDVRAARDGGVVRIEVADTGMGVPEEEQAAIFTRFFRTERARNEAIVGAGLGLSITKTIVEAHDGTIDFTSREGRGTTFTIELPATGPASSGE